MTAGGSGALADVLRNRWRLVVIITVGVVVGAGAYVFSLPDEYDGKAIVAVSPRLDSAGASSDLVRILAPKYVSFITAPATVRDVAEVLGVDAADLDDVVSASLAQDTGTLTITARRESPVEAARDANAFAGQVVAFAENDKLLSAELVARALPPSEPAAPPRMLLLAAALVVGLLIAIGVAVLLERGRPRLRSWKDMTDLTGYPVLGRVPSSRALRSKPSSSFSDPAVGAAFGTLRANLEPMLRDRGIKLLVVTSPSTNDGKTTTAALIAESLSRLGARTLLVDADLRHPGVSKVASIDDQRGLAGVLRGDTPLAHALQRGWFDNLDVLPTQADSDAGDLLAQSFGGVAGQMMSGYDYVVVDTPPLLGADDTRTIISTMHGHGVLFVVSANSPSQPVHEAALALESLRAPVLGIVANRVKERSGYLYAAS